MPLICKAVCEIVNSGGWMEILDEKAERFSCFRLLCMNSNLFITRQVICDTVKISCPFHVNNEIFRTRLNKCTMDQLDLLEPFCEWCESSHLPLTVK